MFFKLVSRNSRRSRKENGLFFTSLVVSIVAFYIILSLAHQDVMIFLTKMESDAVDRLLAMMPAFYGVTLFVLFFLVFYASKFQLERRRHEFGVYLMMGMRRVKLFGMLLTEDLSNSLIALAAGLPVAVFLSELISLVTARVVGLGIIGHQSSLSVSAILYTAVGFLIIKCVAFLILSGRIAKQEIGGLLVDTPEGIKKQLPTVLYAAALAIGIGCLIMAYGRTIIGMSWTDTGSMAGTLALGIFGTFLLFFGLRILMGFFAKRRKRNGPLQVFNFRQLQESVIHRSGMLAVSSLLILAALCCFGAGVSIASYYSGTEPHVLDYTFPCEGQTAEEIKSTLAEHDLDASFSELFEMKTGHIRTTEDYDHAFQMETVMAAVEALPESEDRDILLNNLGYDTYPYLIDESGYNQLLSCAGLPTLKLAQNEAAVYMDEAFHAEQNIEQISRILEERPQVQIDGDTFYLTGEVQQTQLVTDRSIQLSFALIVSDDVFDYYTQGESSAYLNGVLDAGETEQAGLMKAISEMNQRLNDTGLSYESYLQNMGRQLFYVVAASYITIYLAIIFLIIANTMMGVQFLMEQQKSGRRYKTLIRLGAGYEMLCRSAKKQINWYFGIPVAVSAVSSIFGVWGLFTGILSMSVRSDLKGMLLVAAAMILLLCVIECVYMAAVKRSSSRYLLTLLVPEREE